MAKTKKEEKQSSKSVMEANVKNNRNRGKKNKEGEQNFTTKENDKKKILQKKEPGELCNARKSDGSGYCKQPAGFGTDHVGSGRCKYHGGASKGRPVETGLYARQVPEEYEDELRNFLEDEKIGDLKNEIALMRVFISKQFERLSRGEIEMDECMERIGYLVEKVRRLVGSLNKAEQSLNINVTYNDVKKFMADFTAVLKEIINDETIAREDILGELGNRFKESGIEN